MNTVHKIKQIYDPGKNLIHPFISERHNDVTDVIT